MTDDSAGSRTWRTPLLAGLATLVIIVVVAAIVRNNDEEASDPVDGVTSTTTASTSQSPSTSGSPSTSSSTGDPSQNGDPTPSPIIDKAVKAAMKAHFPALVPSGVPEGWSVSDAAYDAKGGGSWRISLTDPDGAEVVLVQTKQSVKDLVERYLGTDAQATGKVDLHDYGTGIWTGYQSSAHDGIGKVIAKTGVLVYGPDQDTAVTLAQELMTAEDADLPEAG